MVLPRTLIPYDDETIFSFIIRLASANGFDDVDKFYRMTISPSCSSAFSGYGNKYSGEPSCVYEDISKLVSVLGERHPIAPEPERFFRLHSLFPLYCMFVKDDKEKEEHVKCYISGNETYKYHIGSINVPDRAICFCKKCINEDHEKYGTKLIHRVHQIAGVNVCPYHNEPLMYAENLTNDNITGSIPVVKHNNLADSSLAYQYAVMCKDLLEKPLETTALDVERVIIKTMNDLPSMLWHSRYNEHDDFSDNRIRDIVCERDKRCYLLHAAQDSYLLENEQGYEKKSCTRGGGTEDPSHYFYSEYRQNVNKALVMLFILYRTADFVRKMISQKGVPTNEDKAKIILNMLTDEYSVESVESGAYNTLLCLRHKNCGRTANFTLRKFMNGDRCPYCQTDHIDFDEYLSGETNGIVKFKDNTAVVNGKKRIKMDMKQVRQELNRPFLSPVLEITRSERISARCEYRAGCLFDRDHTDITGKLETNSNKADIRSFLRRTYPEEEPATITALAENYYQYFGCRGFSIF